MGVRNCSELGENVQLIMKRLLANQNLLKLLYYEDKDPLNHADLTQEQIQNEVFEKLVKIIPRIGPKLDAKSIVVIRVVNGAQNVENNEFEDIEIDIEVFVPLTQWLIKGIQLRPFAILGEIQKSLNGKTINGLGKMVGGDFQCNFFSDEISGYEQRFFITTYD